MSTNRREMVLGELRATTDGFLAAIEGVTPAQWAWTPEPDRWSVGQAAEHVTVVLRGVTKLVTTKLLSMPIPPGQERPTITDDQIVKLLFDRSRRVPAPETVQPTGRWATREECATVFQQARDGMCHWFEATSEDLRQFAAPHPVLGPLDGVQWLLFVAAHTERHTRQVREMRGTAGFPG